MAVREIGTDIKLTGEKEFNDGMKSINSNLKTLRSDMAAVSATFEDNANSVEALTTKNKILQDSVDQHRVKVDALRQMYEKEREQTNARIDAQDRKIARMGSRIETMRPFQCGDLKCKKRVLVTVSECEEIEKTIRPENQKHDIEPENDV